MITNRVQARNTSKKIENFKQSLQGLKAANDSFNVMQQAEYDGIQSLLEELEDELKTYNALKTALTVKVSDVGALAAALISVRIAKNLSQIELARRVGLKKQAIQRYESEQYKGASLDRITKIADAMNVDFAGAFKIGRR